MKAIVLDYRTGGGDIVANVSYSDSSGNIVDAQLHDLGSAGFSTYSDLVAATNTAILAYSVLQSYGLTSTDISNFVGSLSVPAVINSATRSIVTGTGATGFQASATRNVFGSYSLTITSTATIAGNASGTIVLEVAPTNSATAGDWVEVARFTNGQAISLALTLQSVQTLAGQLNGMIPAGYYAKLRSINNAGTPTYTYNSGREILQ